MPITFVYMVKDREEAVAEGTGCPLPPQDAEITITQSWGSRKFRSEGLYHFRHDFISKTTFIYIYCTELK